MCEDKFCVSKLCVSKLCEDKLCVDKLCVSKLCDDKMCEDKLCEDKLCVSRRRREAGGGRRPEAAGYRRLAFYVLARNTKYHAADCLLRPAGNAIAHAVAQSSSPRVLAKLQGLS